MRTLIVDDVPDMRFLMRVTLWTEGSTDITDEASNGEDALVAWRESKPDVVVLDMRMPGISGLDVAREMLTQDPDQRVVMCSAYMDEDDVAEATSIGVAACVDKYKIMTLPDVVGDVLRTG
ncbi:MAG: response regulator transcription factor [Frankiales bacterium]|nr:response regulator transcription factor [Frankiales bacterium]